MAYETGSCNYTVVWKVYFHVSGNELLGKQQILGSYESKMAAELALVDDGFSRKPDTASTWWRRKYATAYISREVKYDFK